VESGVSEMLAPLPFARFLGMRSYHAAFSTPRLEFDPLPATIGMKTAP
jgi:hypothetical protein